VKRRLLFVVFAAIAVTCSSIVVMACNDKTTSASNTSAATAVTATSNGACSAAMAAKCTPEMAAACKAKAAAAASQCPYHNSNAAVTASSYGACTHGTAAAAAGACANKTSAAAAGMGSCADKGAQASSACSLHRAGGVGVTFEAVSLGGASCSGKTMGATASNGGHNCDACADLVMCESQLKSAGSSFQVVPLKNGVMYVYTTGDPRNVRTVQSAIARRTERMNTLLTADNAKLCPDCKQMRGAIASGKLTREVVNIEGGSISLVTSNDPAMVARLYAMAGLYPPRGIKS